VMLGYYRDEEATEEAFSDGWLHSGDLGVMHPDGYVELRDRAKDIVISGGENISTIEVEQALAAHPAVVQAAVIGIPDERWGELVAAIVVSGAERPNEADLIAFARERLAGYETPKLVIWADELPETVGGKILKYKLRERYGTSTSLPK
jgi:fatty-acyl-CoA synthase